MTLGQVVGSALSRIGGKAAPAAGAAAPARAVERPVAQERGVKVTLSPEARQHLSRLEEFTAAIGTKNEKKAMKPPGVNLDMRA